jgi:hypothetical protein
MLILCVREKVFDVVVNDEGDGEDISSKIPISKIPGEHSEEDKARLLRIATEKAQKGIELFKLVKSKLEEKGSPEDPRVFTSRAVAYGVYSRNAVKSILQEQEDNPQDKPTGNPQDELRMTINGEAQEILKKQGDAVVRVTNNEEIAETGGRIVAAGFSAGILGTKDTRTRMPIARRATVTFLKCCFQLIGREERLVAFVRGFCNETGIRMSGRGIDESIKRVLNFTRKQGMGMEEGLDMGTELRSSRNTLLELLSETNRDMQKAKEEAESLKKMEVQPE